MTDILTQLKEQQDQKPSLPWNETESNLRPYKRLNTSLKEKIRKVFFIIEGKLKDKHASPDLVNHLVKSMEGEDDDAEFIYEPEKVEIDFETIKKVENNVKGEEIQFYKDGIITSHCGNYKLPIELTVSDREAEAKFHRSANAYIEDVIRIVGKCLFITPRTFKKYLSLIKEHGIVVYVTRKELHKRHGFKFVWKRDSEIVQRHIIRLEKIIKESDKDSIEHLQKSFDEKKLKEIDFTTCSRLFFDICPQKFIDTYYLPFMGLGASNAYLKNTLENPNISMTKDDMYAFMSKRASILPTKKELIQGSWVEKVFATIVNYTFNILNLYKVSEGTKEENLDRERMKKAQFDFGDAVDELDSKYKGKNFAELVAQIATDCFHPCNYEVYKEKTKTMAMNEFYYEQNGFLFRKVWTDLMVIRSLLNLTARGIQLPDGRPIEYENFTQSDCSTYWAYFKLNLFFSGFLKPDSAFICTSVNTSDSRFDVMKNDKKIREIHADNTTFKDERIKPSDRALTNISVLVNEITEKGTGEWIPYNAAVECRDDPRYKCARFIETQDHIYIFLKDKDDREACEVYHKAWGKFSYDLVNGEHFTKEEIEDFKERIYEKLMGVIRDFKILIERDRTMGTRGYQTPKGVNTTQKLNIYLPRTRYRTVARDEDFVEREKDYQSASNRFNGNRRAHTRRLPVNYKPSKTQLILAEKDNIPVPDGHTYVRKTIYGENGVGKIEYNYRSKNFTGLMYVTESDRKHVEFINELSPAGFEEQMSEFLERVRKWNVAERSNYDGGIDIRAYKDCEDGVTRKLLVQCKHWPKRSVPPGVVRELIASGDLEQADEPKVLMIITSGKFTSGAIELAKEHNIELIDGDTLLNEME